MNLTHLAALELGPDGSLTAIYPTGRETLELKAADAATPRALRFTGSRGHLPLIISPRTSSQGRGMTPSPGGP